MTTREDIPDIALALPPGGDEPASVIDYAPPRLAADTGLLEAARFLTRLRLWGVPLVDGDADYVGMLTLRSLVAVALPVALDTDSSGPAHAALGRLRLDGVLDRPARQLIDLDVPAVRISTKWPQLLTALCRRAPLVPIVSDTGMRLLGVASLARAANLLYRGSTDAADAPLA